MVRVLFSVIFVVYVNLVENKNLPSYIKPCKRLDPNLNTCAKQNAIEALPQLLQGDTSFKIPSYLPFFIPLVGVTGTGGIKFQLNNLRLYGLNETQIENVKFDLQNYKIYVKVFIPKTITMSQYTIDGRILSIPLKGDGPAEMKLSNVTVEYFMDYKLIEKSDKRHYMAVEKTQLIIKNEHSHYYFGNLFGGNKLLEDNFNMLLNENSKEIDELSIETTKEVINSIVSSIFSALFKVPYDKLFID